MSAWTSVGVALLSLVIGFIVGRQSVAATRQGTAATKDAADQQSRTWLYERVIQVGECLDSLETAARYRIAGGDSHSLNAAQERLSRISQGLGFDFDLIRRGSASDILPWIREAKSAVEARLTELGEPGRNSPS